MVWNLLSDADSSPVSSKLQNYMEDRQFLHNSLKVHMEDYFTNIVIVEY